ncbi:poly-beta-1,6-N-acetyl-D-glucosamine biosynthesis protein PgaD [Dryocola sp. BD626]|uniref:poly-beta-1,6-N-acetyl-D-glucosamine biosynthesis protein PgaD n=1 Tax=Dryocola sp. BD626 TaxID=3133273 RepID=UPI003F4FCBD8
MNQPLVYTEQRLFPRLMDTVLTLGAWVGFTWLIYNGLINALAHSPFMGIRPFFTTLNTVSLYLIIALVNGLALIGWAKYNQYRFRSERRSRRPGLAESELAESMHITPLVAHELNKGRVLTVFHHENGEIARVEVVKGIMDNLLGPPVNSASGHYAVAAPPVKVGA